MPVGDFGMASTNWTAWIRLWGATRCVTSAMISSTLASPLAILPVARALEAAEIAGEEGGVAGSDGQPAGGLPGRRREGRL